MKRCNNGTYWEVALLLVMCIGIGMINAQDSESIKEFQCLEKTASTLSTVGLVLGLTATAIPLVYAAVKSNNRNETEKGVEKENRTDSLVKTPNERSLQ